MRNLRKISRVAGISGADWRSGRCQLPVVITDSGISKFQVREAYLYDYKISVRLLDIDDDGLIVSRIRNVTLSR